MTSDAYMPVSCEQHSEYELAIMRGQKLAMTWLNEQGMQQGDILTPYDLLTEQKIEYLLARDSNDGDKKIRLDKIIEVSPCASYAL